MIQMIVNRITSLVLCRLGYRREKEAEDEKFVKVSGTDRSRLIDNDYFENPDSIFFWPGIFTDVASYRRSCPECQKNTAKGRVSRAPLISIPSIEEPFKRIAIDFVGPLPLSEGKNRYILVCIDYATRYPEAVPLKTQNAETVANTLLGIFSKVGIPTEILSDQGSNVMSD